MTYEKYRKRMPLIAAQLGVPVPEGQGVDQFLPFLERMRQEGAIALVKLDGERRGPNDAGPYTAVVSGGPLRGEHFRTDASTLEDALTYIVVSYFETTRQRMA